MEVLQGRNPVSLFYSNVIVRLGAPMLCGWLHAANHWFVKSMGQKNCILSKNRPPLPPPKFELEACPQKICLKITVTEVQK
jgi:hypothetical protein